MKTLLFSFLITLSFLTYSQQKSPFQLRPKVGVSYQQSDIDDKIGASFGLGVFKQLNPSKHWISTSLGINYSYQQNTGQNYNASTTSVVSTDKDYPSNPYKFQNYQSKSHFTSLTLELGVQKLKELTNVNLYGFGGIGLLSFQSNTNQKDANGNLYDYSKIGTGFFSAEADLNLLLDKTHETNLEKNNIITPHFGFGIGYRLSPQIAVNFEQNFIIPKTDLLDGTVWNKDHTNSNTNDRLSSSTLSVTIGLGKSVAPSSKQEKPITPQVSKPFIDMKQPSYKLTSSAKETYTIKATLRNITDLIQVSIEQNGKVIIPKNLEFNKYSGQISFDVKLVQKEERFKIYVYNEAGNHFRLFTIKYTGTNTIDATATKDTVIKPMTPPITTKSIIEVISPQKSFIESCHAFILFKSDVNLTENQIITLSNNQPVSYTKTGNDYIIEKAIVGTETFRIITSNTETRQEKQITYRCKPENEQLTVPKITVREPITGTLTTTDNSLRIFANFKARADKITVRINGQIHLTKTHLSGIATTIPLPKGDLKITLETENSAGKDKKTFFIKRP